MKRTLFLLTIHLFFVGILFAQTNNNKAINFYTNEGHSMYFVSDIDSITHNTGSIIFYLNHKESILPIANVDSIVFSRSDIPSYFPIIEEGLEGWAEGYMNNDGCFIVCRQESDGGYFAFIGQKEIDEAGITFRFDENMEIQSIFSSKGGMNVIKGDNDKLYALYVLQDSTYIDELPDPKPEEMPKYGVRRLSSSTLNTICNIVNLSLTMGDFGNLFSNGNGYTSTFLANLTPSLMMLPSYGNLGLSALLYIMEKMYEERFYKLLYDCMGPANTWISDIDEKNAPNYIIEASIQGLDTFGKPITCFVYSGIAVRRNDSHVTYDNCDFHIEEHETKIDEVYYAQLDVEKKTNYYLRPYIVVKLGSTPLTRPKYLFGGPEEPIIIYGDVDKIFYNPKPSCSTGDLISKTATSAVVNCSYSNVEGYECGVMISSNNEAMSYPTYCTDGERPINLTGLTPSTTYEYWAFVIADGEAIPGEKKSFTTDYSGLCPDDNHPHAIDLGLPSGTKWCCCNVGASAPEEYGCYYAWGETCEKNFYGLSTYQYAFADDSGCYLDEVTNQLYKFIDIGSDIAGTSYDAVTVNMGAPWRMPSTTQQQELIDKCTRQWTQQNGVNGILVTGPNGGQIFLPAAGYRWRDELHGAGIYGIYWSSSLRSYDYADAYDLYFDSNYWYFNFTNGARVFGPSVRAVRP